jgi:hypothetical protein
MTVDDNAVMVFLSTNLVVVTRWSCLDSGLSSTTRREWFGLAHVCYQTQDVVRTDKQG